MRGPPLGVSAAALCALALAGPLRAGAEPPSPAPGAGDPADDEPDVASQFSAFKPTFLLTGLTAKEHLQAKLQFSVKFNFWPSRSPHSLYFAYTQKSVWAIWDFSHSQPMLESNYNPELFYAYSARLLRSATATSWTCQLLGVRGGVEHESNGIGEVQKPPPGARSNSRGWNRLYGYARGGCSLPEGTYATVDLKVWPLVFGAFDDPDITSYLGYGSLGFEVGWDRPLGVGARRWIAGLSAGAATTVGSLSPFHGGLTAWLQLRPTYGGRTSSRYLPALYVMLYKGYGETLLRYDVEVTTVYVGLALDDHLIWEKAESPNGPEGKQ